MDKSMHIVIIGGVAGGASAAARARRLSETAEITIIEQGEYVSFANCGLPYHIGGIIPNRNDLLIQTPESLYDRFRINVRVQTEARSINRAGHCITVHDLKTGRTEDIPYDKLILAPGASAFRPPIPGIDLNTVLTLQAIPDMDAIIRQIRDKNAKRAVVVGGGFIGIEVAENLALKGIKVILVEADRQVLPPFDPEMAEILHQHLLENGIDIHLEQKAMAISQQAGSTQVTLDNGDILSCDLVVMASGVRPRTKLAQEAGLTLGVTKAIQVDDRMLTSDPDIYAVGDAIEITQPVTGLPGYIPLAGPANRQGRIVADQIFGRDSRYRGTLGSSICKVFKLAAGAVGCSEKILKKINKPYQKAFIHAANHASYYPGAHLLTLKMLYDPHSGQILGAQAIGADGVDKRIDIIATAMAGQQTVFDLQHLELTYAPPFGSAKDPINLVGFVAANTIRGDHRPIQAEDIAQLDPTRIILLDVRTVREHRLGKIPGSINIPLNDLRRRLAELPRDKQLVIYCQAGLRGYIAQRLLTQQGFDAVNVAGGYKTWRMVTV